PPSTSALNSTVSGADPSSGVPSAHARSGAGSSFSAFPAAAVVVVAALEATVVVVACGVSVFAPPPHPASTRSRARARVAEHATARDALTAFSAAATAAVDRVVLAGADALLVFFAGPGRESHVASGDPKDPWSNYTVVAPSIQAPGARPFQDACVIAEKEVRP